MEQKKKMNLFLKSNGKIIFTKLKQEKKTFSFTQQTMKQTNEKHNRKNMFRSNKFSSEIYSFISILNIFMEKFHIQNWFVTATKLN